MAERRRFRSQCSCSSLPNSSSLPDSRTARLSWPICLIAWRLATMSALFIFVLAFWSARTKMKSADMVANLHAIKQIGHESRAVLESGKLDEFGKLLHEHWERKRRRSAMISNSQIDYWYDFARRNGALGGKLIGAGGGGFLMFLADDPRKLRKAMEAQGLPELRFRFDFKGTTVFE